MFRKDRFARCRTRFVVPVILIEGKVVKVYVFIKFKNSLANKVYVQCKFFLIRNESF